VALACRPRTLKFARRAASGWRMTGIAFPAAGDGFADPAGLDVSILGWSGGRLRQQASPAALRHSKKRSWSWLQRRTGGLRFFEAQRPLNVENGQPAVDHIRAALEHGAHAVTANKGPVVYALTTNCGCWRRTHGKRFSVSSPTVMDGVPIFSLFPRQFARDPFAWVPWHPEIPQTNVILAGMEDGLSFRHCSQESAGNRRCRDRGEP